jgi:hypothetical protein
MLCRRLAAGYMDQGRRCWQALLAAWIKADAAMQCCACQQQAWPGWRQGSPLTQPGMRMNMLVCAFQRL